MTTVVKFYAPYQVVPSQLQLQIITNLQRRASVITRNMQKPVVTLFDTDFAFSILFVVTLFKMLIVLFRCTLFEWTKLTNLTL